MTTRKRFNILYRDDFTCGYCGKREVSLSMHIDHIKPLSKGGGSEPSNLVTSCKNCNMLKGNKRVKDRPRRGKNNFRAKKADALYLELRPQNYRLPVTQDTFGTVRIWALEHRMSALEATDGLIRLGLSKSRRA